MTARDYIALLRGLAAEKGYRVQRAIRRNHWQLIDDDGNAAINPVNRSTSFTLPAALQFLGETKLTRRRPPDNHRPKRNVQEQQALSRSAELHNHPRRR